MNRSRRWPVLCGCFLVAQALGLADEGPPPFEEIFPHAPEDLAVSRSRPVFHIGFTGVDPYEARLMRFKLALSEDGFITEAYVFNQRNRQSGWIQGQPGEMIYRPRRPLRDGEYEWKAWAWNGVNWVDGGGSRTIRIDSIPPAEIQDLALMYFQDSTEMIITWDPVSLDQQNNTEFVSGYHVYAFPGRPDLPVARTFRIGVVDTPRYVEPEATPADHPIMYYRVQAVDEAGNVSGLRN
jgi:hypothetical protein